MDEIVDWERFWCPPEGVFSTTDDGFLVDPYDSDWLAFAGDLRSFREIDQLQCLALLGEPGLGKTSALKAAEQATRQRGDATVFLDLAAYGSEDRLISDLEGYGAVVQWLSGSDELTLFLDSLDECLLRISNVSALLLQVLPRYPLNRLRLRIACRSAEWPPSLDAGLKSLWPGETGYGSFELAPLRRRDVMLAASAHLRSEAERFVEEVLDRDAVPLAVKPVTLDLLLRLFRSGGALPHAQKELYERGIVLLCGEEARRTALSAGQKAAVASRIAALTLLGARRAIWVGPDRGETEDTDLLTAEVLGGAEQWGAESVDVTHQAVEEVLRTGLFSLRGLARHGWAHQSYADFLAARYLVTRLSERQIASLVTHGGDVSIGVVPQLESLVAWIATQSSAFFRLITESSPQTLLYSDVATVDDNDKMRLVTSLLELYEAGKLVDTTITDRRRFRRLAFDGLAAALRPYISDSNRNRFARRTAVDIAEACLLSELQPELLSVALNEDELESMRTEAVMALSRLGDAAARSRLADLVRLYGHQLGSELLGAMLIATWPDYTRAETVFELLEVPPDSSIMGTYWLFVTDRLVPALDPDGTRVALEWLGRLPELRSVDYLFQRLAESLVEHAINHLPNLEIRSQLSRILADRLRRHETIKGIPKGDEHIANRRALALSVLRELSVDELGFYGLVREGFFMPSDLEWLLGLLEEQTEDLDSIAALIPQILDVRNKVAVQQVMETASRVSELLTRLEPLLRPVGIDSEESTWMRSAVRQAAGLGIDETSSVDDEMRNAITRLLERAEAGDLSAWWELTVLIARGGSEFEVDVRSLPIWSQLDSELQNRLVTSAALYAENANPSPDTWMQPGRLDRPAFAIVKALVLMERERPGTLENIPADRWRLLGPIVLWYGSILASPDAESLRPLIAEACAKAPEPLHALAPRLLEAELESSEADPDVFRVVSSCDDDQTWGFILNHASSPASEPRVTRSALSAAFDRQPAEAMRIAIGLVRDRVADAESASRATEAAVLLVTRGAENVWPVLWDEMSQDTGLTQEVFLRVSHGDSLPVGELVARIGEASAADLFLLLWELFPPAEDPNPAGAHFVSPRESLGRWRDGLARVLRDSGSESSLAELRRVAIALPDLDWIGWWIIEAEAAYRREAWAAIRPADLLELARNADARFVSDSQSLLAVLEESLARLQGEMHGETPTVRALWNESRDSITRKNEAALSDFVKVHLNRDLLARRIIVNREVQIRGRGPAGTGEEVDIHVDALLSSESSSRPDRLSAIIEVKGDWNPDVLSAMESQLVGRYLVADGISSGIYLVGYFGSQPASLDELRSTLSQQAYELSAPPLRVSAVVLDARYR